VSRFTGQYTGDMEASSASPAQRHEGHAELMTRLGYTRYVAQGGDWGAPISSAMARQAPPRLLGMHLNYPASVPPDIDQALRNGDPAPAGLSIDENAAFDALRTFAANGSGYRVMMGNALDTGGHFAAWGQPELFAAELRAAFRPLRAAQ
jgi:pimeloyl-ACP methyl ester carboxylesterase